MKKYEKMSKDEIISWLEYHTIIGTSLRDFYNKLMKEVEEIPRWKTIQSDDDLQRIFSEFRETCDEWPCRECDFRSNDSPVDCFVNYLMQKVETEVEE